MARRLMILGALLLVLAPSIGLPQAGPMPTPAPIYPAPPPAAPGWNNAGAYAFPSAPGTGWGVGRRLYADEQWFLKGNVEFGHMWMRFNTFFPFNSNPTGQQVFAFERMDLQLQDGNFWVGFAGLEAQPLPSLVLYGRYGINVPRLSHMLMDATGTFTSAGTAIIGDGVSGAPANAISPWTWDTTIHWWMWETGGAWWFTPELAFESGFRYEHIDYRLQNPRGVSEAVAQSPPGLAITSDRILSGGVHQGDGTDPGISDPLGKIYWPYIGIRGKCRKPCGCDTVLCYRWRFIGSPIAWVNWKDPFRINSVSATGLREIHQTLYTLNTNSGGFLEGEFEGMYPVTCNLRGTCWFSAGWFQSTGTGELTSTVVASDVFGVAAGSVSIPESRFQRSFYAFGLGMEMSF
jgi:hypothetical protein